MGRHKIHQTKAQAPRAGARQCQRPGARQRAIRSAPAAGWACHARLAGRRHRRRRVHVGAALHLGHHDVPGGSRPHNGCHRLQTPGGPPACRRTHRRRQALRQFGEQHGPFPRAATSFAWRLPIGLRPAHHPRNPGSRQIRRCRTLAINSACSCRLFNHPRLDAAVVVADRQNPRWPCRPSRFARMMDAALKMSRGCPATASHLGQGGAMRCLTAQQQVLDAVLLAFQLGQGLVDALLAEASIGQAFDDLVLPPSQVTG